MNISDFGNITFWSLYYDNCVVEILNPDNYSAAMEDKLLKPGAGYILRLQHPELFKLPGKEIGVSVRGGHGISFLRLEGIAGQSFARVHFAISSKLQGMHNVASLTGLRFSIRPEVNYLEEDIKKANFTEKQKMMLNRRLPVLAQILLDLELMA